MPWKKRTAASCVYVLHAAEHIVMQDHTMSVNGSQIPGRTFWMIRECGIAPTTEPATKRESRMEYSLPLRERSSRRPATYAFAKD
jgi:hypothetical protein